MFYLRFWRNSSGNIPAAAFQFMETAYDTIIFAMIIYKTIQSIRTSRKTILAVLAAHGVLCFLYVVSVPSRRKSVLTSLKCRFYVQFYLGHVYNFRACEKVFFRWSWRA